MSKKQTIKEVDTDVLKGYAVLTEILEIAEPQTWTYNGEDTIVCDRRFKWLTILPRDQYYCITAMMDRDERIILWYIDMIADQGIEDALPFFYDLYLDLIVYPNGEIFTDDMDELVNALRIGDITEQQFNLAIETKEKLEQTMLSNMKAFKSFTKNCLAYLR